MPTCPPGPLDGGRRRVIFCAVFHCLVGTGDMQEQFDPGGDCEVAGEGTLERKGGSAPLGVLGWGRRAAGRIVRGLKGGQALAELLYQGARQDGRHFLGGAVVVVAADQPAAAGQMVDTLDGG